MSLGTHTDTRIDNTHGVLKVCRLVPTAKSSNYKIIIKEHMINCLKQCIVNREMISNTPTTGTVVVQCMGVEGVKVMNEMIPEVGLDSVPDSVNGQICLESVSNIIRIIYLISRAHLGMKLIYKYNYK